MLRFRQQFWTGSGKHGGNVKQLWVTAKRLPKMLANLDIRVKIIGLAVGSVIVLGAVATLYMY